MRVELRPKLFLFPEEPLVGKKYYIQPDAEINNSILVGLQIPMDTELSFGVSPTGGSYVGEAGMKNMFLTLCDNKGVELFKELPLYTFMAVKNSGVQRMFFNHKIDVSKSFFRTVGTGGLGASNLGFMLNFFIQSSQK